VSTKRAYRQSQNFDVENADDANNKLKPEKDESIFCTNRRAATLSVCHPSEVPNALQKKHRPEAKETATLPASRGGGKKKWENQGFYNTIGRRKKASAVGRENLTRKKPESERTAGS